MESQKRKEEKLVFSETGGAVGSLAMGWINSRREWLIRKYPGKWIALAEGAREEEFGIFVGDDLLEARGKAIQAGAKPPYCLFKVPESKKEEGGIL